MNLNQSHETPSSARSGRKRGARRRREAASDRRRRTLILERLEARELLAVYAIPTDYLSRDSGAGLLGSYVNQSLRSYATQDDWRVSQAISGTRVDATVNFASNGWGVRSAVGVTGGSDSNWDYFSVQWDGYLSIAVAGTRLYTRSDDGSRLWIDLNNDSVFNSSGNLQNAITSIAGRYYNIGNLRFATGKCPCFV